MKQRILFYILVLLLSSACTSTHSKISNVVTRKNDAEEILNIPKETAKSIGLKTELVQRKKVNFQIKYNGIVKSIPNKSFFIASPVNGRVLRVFVEPNQITSKSEKLAEILSQDVAEVQFDITKQEIELEGDIEQAKLELNLAKSNFERESKLFEDGITAKKDFLEAENRYKRAENNLAILEKKRKSINELSEKRLSILGAHINNPNYQAGFVEIKIPGDAVILKRLINPGEVVEEDKVLFEASDLREVFVESQVYEKDLPKINLGEGITFVTEAYPGYIFSGKINYISQFADPQTRTVAVRAKVQNPGFNLKPEMFGKMLISLSDTEALVINKEAVQKVDNENVIYIKVGNGFKEVKPKLGKETDGFVEILDGLKVGQEIVTQGSFWLKSELHAD